MWFTVHFFNAEKIDEKTHRGLPDGICLSAIAISCFHPIKIQSPAFPDPPDPDTLFQWYMLCYSDHALPAFERWFPWLDCGMTMSFIRKFSCSFWLDPKWTKKSRLRIPGRHSGSSCCTISMVLVLGLLVQDARPVWNCAVAGLCPSLFPAREFKAGLYGKIFNLPARVCNSCQLFN